MKPCRAIRFFPLILTLCSAIAALAAPTVGPISAKPSSILVGVSTPVTVTVDIRDHPTVLPGGVNLLQVDSSGNTLSVLGVMTDSGGGVFTLVVSFNPPQTGAIYLQASAAFKGVLLRVKSSVLSLPVSSGSGTPAITGFNPQSGPVGTLVNVTLSNFSPSQGASPQVTLSALSGRFIAAPVSTFSANSLSFVVPAGAKTGKVMVAFGAQKAVSPNALSVTTSSAFTLSVGPATATLLPGQTASYAVAVNSPNGFDGLATLAVSGLPSGVQAAFKPPAVTAGQTSVLTLSAHLSQAAGTATLTISAAATIEGQPVSQSASAMLKIVPVTTSFLGRTVVDDTQETPVSGATVKFTGKDSRGNSTACSGQTTSDAGGNFALTNLPASCTGPQLIAYDGSTATSPAGKYAGVNLSYTLASGQVTTSPVLIHLPRIDDGETVMVRQNAGADQIFTFKTLPKLVVTVYKGTIFKLDDGTQPDPFPLVAIDVPLDRLPDKMPSSGMVMPFIVAFQPANAYSSQPVAVDFPNSLNMAPAGHATLMTLDPTRGFMVPYGTGTVSNDGTQILADADPLHRGHSYGLLHFDWHGPTAPPPPDINPGPDAGGGPPPQSPPPQGPSTSGGGSQSSDCQSCDCPDPGACTGADPVDFSSGIVTYTSTDLVIRGGRGSIGLVRTYRTLSSNPGPFGLGTSSTYGYALNTLFGGVITLLTPTGSQFPLNLQKDGTFADTTIPFLQGAVLTASGGTYTLRWKDGTIYQFQTLLRSEAILTSITDPNKNTISLTLNPSQPLQITQITDPVGRSLTLTYDSSNRITSASDPIGRTVSYTYNSQGLLSTFTDAAAGVTKYTYDAKNNLATVTDPLNTVVQQNSYDEDNGGRVIHQIEANGGNFFFSYTLQNTAVPTSPVLQTVVTDPLKNQTTYRFDPNGFLLSVTDASGQVRTLTRDPAHSNLVAAYSGAGSCSVCGNPAIGNVNYTFNSAGNVLTRTDALGNKTSFTYDPVFNKITSITDPLGHVSNFVYDSAGNLATSIDPNGNKTSYTYLFGEVTQLIDGIGNTTVFSYDSFGNLISTTDPLGNTTSIVYDAASRPIQTIDAIGRQANTAYDNLNRITSITDSHNNTTQFVYDKNSNLLSLKDAKGNQTSFTYDAMNRLLVKTDPLSHTDARTYDNNGNLIKFVDRRGQASQFSYDQLNRLTSEKYDDGSVVSRVYDANSRPTNVTDSTSGSFDFRYDLAGLLISSANPFGAVLYAYDSVSRLTSREVVGQSPVEYAYDSNSNLLSAALSTTSASFKYDSDNRLSAISRANGVSSLYAYDHASNLLSITHSGGAGINIPLTYSYDAVGNRENEATNIAQPLITQAATSTYNKANQLVSSTLAGVTTSYSYDANGNLLFATNPTGTTNYVWDTRNRLTSISQPSGQKTNLLYDFSTNLIEQADSGSTLNLTQQFVLDGITNVAYVNRSSGDNFSVLTGLVIDQDLAILHSTGQIEYGLKNAINGTIATVDQTGAGQGQFLYEPFGQTTAKSSVYLFKYTGRVPVSANVYYDRARYYSTPIGRFISEDPIAFGAGRSLYAYAENNTLKYRDPSGLQSIATNGSLGTISTATILGGPPSSYYLPTGLAQPWQGGTWTYYDNGPSIRAATRDEAYGVLFYPGPDRLREFSECQMANGPVCQLGAPENPHLENPVEIRPLVLKPEFCP